MAKIKGFTIQQLIEGKEIRDRKKKLKKIRKDGFCCPAK